MAAPTVDHVVLAYPSLGTARAAFTSLGFQVAPDAAHPFGTGNACVFLADGTYLEPLVVLDREAARAASEAGNSFTAHALAVEPRSPALSGLALVSTDAAADRDGFAARGLGAADLVEFSRLFRDGDGREQVLSFRLALARAPALAGTLVFTCQRLSGAAPDRSAYARHPNGVAGLARVVFAGEGAAARRLLADLLGGEPETLRPPAEPLTPAEIARRYGEAVELPANGVRLAGLVLRCGDLAALRSAGGTTFTSVEGRFVQRLAGGGFLAFEGPARE